jgi:hypothetical protein
VRYVDGAVPAELKTRLERALDAIAAEPDKDFHPGSEGKVRGAPTLECLVREECGVTSMMWNACGMRV